MFLFLHSLYFLYKRSMTMAEAPPPPLQTAATPYLPSLPFKTDESVVMIRAPEQPKGWPIATAPPQTLL